MADVPGSMDQLVGKPDEITTADTRPISVNLLGSIYSVQLFCDYVRKGVRREGVKIVVTSSGAGLYPMPSHPVYAASKHAVESPAM